MKRIATYTRGGRLRADIIITDAIGLRKINSRMTIEDEHKLIA